MSSTFGHESSSSTSSGIIDLDDPTEASSIPPASNEFVGIPPDHSNEGVIFDIEQLFKSMVDSIAKGVELTIPYRTRSTRTSHSTTRTEIPTHRYWTRSKSTSRNTTQDGSPTQTQRDLLMFPARNLRKQKRFVVLFRILELVHDALRSGNLVTKRFEQETHIPRSLFKGFDTNRSIYYQNIELFASQAIVDHMVDNLAFTLGVGRGDLNIVAAAKGLVAGPIDLKIRYGSIIQCGLSQGSGVLLPSINSVEAVDFRSAKWLLVIEKEATFRTLAASKYYSTSKAGPGILVTAKGFPDLATRRFLHVIRTIRPEMVFFGLVDFNPHGISIFRTYESGSRRLEHERDVTVPGLKWLGIRSGDIQTYISGDDAQPPSTQSSQSSSQSSWSQSSQESIAYSFDGSDYEGPPRKRIKLSDIPSTDSGSIAPLTASDRKRAVNLLKELAVVRRSEEGYDTAMDQIEEAQKMLMMNVKAEIQAVDTFGDITDWLDQKLCLHFLS